jgi:CO dehydrogenase maturation factor
MVDAMGPGENYRHRLGRVAKSIREAQPNKRPPAGQFRVVITGKGGVGKTSLTALLARLLARKQLTVLALDADPQMNLPYALGLPPAEARRIVPLSANADYVEEKTGARPGMGWGLFFRLNPDVADVVERFGVVGPDGVRLLVMGTLIQPAAGCFCPENSLLASVVNAINLREGEAILMDTQAGVEHFGRALAAGFHQAIVVADATFNAIQVAMQTARLARGLGIPAVHLVINRVRNESDHQRALDRVAAEGGFPFLTTHALPYDERVLESDPAVGSLLETPETAFIEAVRRLRDTLIHSEQEVGTHAHPDTGSRACWPDRGGNGPSSRSQDGHHPGERGEISALRATGHGRLLPDR